MISKTFIGFVIFCIIASGIIIYTTSNKIDDNNYLVSAEISGIWVTIMGVLWAISLFLYDRYGDGNILLAIIWFRPLFRIMAETIGLLFLVK
jgi:hypothetical protein